MIKLFAILSLLALSTLSFTYGQRFNFEGELIYFTNDPIQETIPVDSAAYIKYFVRGEEVRVESVTQMGKQVYLINHREQKAVLMLSFANRHVALVQDLTKDTITKNYTIKKSCKSQKIGTLKGSKATLSGEHLTEPITLFYSKKYPNYIVDIYNGVIPGLPLSYDLIIQGDRVNYEIVKLEEKTISDDYFHVPAHYTVMTMEEFLQQLSPE